jgi:uncharacterized protein (TIGR02145 family)
MTQNLRYIPDSEDGYIDYSHNGASLGTPYEEKRYAFPRSTGNGEYPANPDELTAIQTAWEGSDDLQKMGVYYNWAAATNNKISSAAEGNKVYGPNYEQIRGICPSGWHLPSDWEWFNLEEVIAGDANTYSSPGGITDWDDETFRATAGWYGQHGQKMKSTTSVNGEPTGGTSNPATAGGFDALFVGAVYNGNSITSFMATYFWSSSSHNGPSGLSAWYRHLKSDQGMGRYYHSRSYLHSVRCKKDE